MEDHEKVFSSNITRSERHSKNNLYDLLKLVPAVPIKLNEPQKYTCIYTPKTDKFYIPKRKSKLKVKTVRDIRKAFEQDTFSYLISELETQENVLFKKIRRGSSRDNNTIFLAKRMLRGDTPISRSTWEMLINLNPENHIHARQYVLWNGKYIQVNGSTGGTKKMISSYDLARKYKKLPARSSRKKTMNQEAAINKKTGLLRNSLAVKFKPGPLVRKNELDDSHQKYHIGNIELIDLPKLGLEVLPKYGSPLDSTITTFLINMRNQDGTISQKWAEFAISVLGKNEKSTVTQLNKDGVTFDLAYKYNQNRILMRRDLNSEINTSKAISTYASHADIQTNNLTVLPEVEDVVNRILDSVEINLIQDKLYIAEEENTQLPLKDLKNVVTETNVKDKTKRKFCELDRLDVTVIQLPETEDQHEEKSCVKAHCTLGCICSSLECKYKLKQHCGKVECMFDCKCDFSAYSDDLSQTLSSELMPGLLNLDKEINLKLAKEEKKFHQTVIVTGEKRILLKAKKRSCKASKKYTDFYENQNKYNQQSKDLSIVLIKLDCNNIEPWCMVHKLYKCFCKGKFAETCAPVLNETIVKDPKESVDVADKNTVHAVNKNTVDIVDKNTVHVVTKNTVDIVDKKTDHVVNKNPVDAIDKNKEVTTKINYPIDKSNNCTGIGKFVINIEERYETEKADKNINTVVTRPTTRKSASSDIWTNNKNKNYIHDNSEITSESESSDYLDSYGEKHNTCARTDVYTGRKFTDGYYKNMNYKILEMEKNDKRLQKKLASLNNAVNSESEKSDAVATNSANNCSGNMLDSNDSNDTTNLLEPDITDDTNILELLCDAREIFGPAKCSDNEMREGEIKRKRLSNETRLVAWLETNYKQYKIRNDKGLLKNTLEPPKHGKVALHSWEFVLNRYRERKNLFLITKQKPYRIFMAVHTRNPFFDNCININEIRFADLHKYPQTVKNLLINATDLKDNFCILRGLAYCWEVIGSVTKVKDGSEDAPEINVECSDIETLVLFDEKVTVDTNTNTEQKDVKYLFTTSKELQTTDESSEDCVVNSEGSSKWFVMTVENDFSEIRFFKKGFFVKYESIINAIDVARVSGKTVRLSSKKCTEHCDIPQFGIYAIPNTTEHCVFIGPYELEETLGVETIKTILDVRKLKRTRGFWITTNKVDNLKVVENPLSFMPLTNSENINALPLENHFSAINDINNKRETSNSKRIDDTQEGSSSKNEFKIVKPIKIRKTNGFYHLASDGVLKKISAPQTKLKSIILHPCLNIGSDINNSLVSENVTANTISEADVDATSQIKISAVFSTQNEDSVPNNIKQDKGMFILKPEEINRKLLQCKDISESRTLIYEDDLSTNTETKNYDSNENNAANIATTSRDQTGDVFVISDDENDLPRESENKLHNTDVWIVCTNCLEIGFIFGRWNSNNFLSFKFSECEFSEFYLEEEAFSKINLEIYKKTKNLKALQLQWKICKKPDEIHGGEFNLESFKEDDIFIVEELDTSYLPSLKKSNLKTYSKLQSKDMSVAPSSSSAIEISSKMFPTGVSGTADSVDIDDTAYKSPRRE